MAYSEAYKNVTKPFVSGDPRRINKPIGARERQITKARKILERTAKLQEKQAEVLGVPIENHGLTELEAIYEIQVYKAKTGDKDAYKAVMDYAGYKPSEHVEFNDNTERLTEEEKKRDLDSWFAEKYLEISQRSDEVLTESQTILSNNIMEVSENHGEVSV